MKGKIEVNIQTFLIFIIGIFFLRMLIVIILSRFEKDGLLDIIEDNTCILKEIGVTEKERRAYS